MPQDIKISFPTEDNNKQCSIVLDATQNVFDLISVLTRQLPLLDTIVYNKQELKPTQLESLGVVFAQAINDQGGLFNKPTINLDCTFKRPVHILLPKKNNPREITIYINPNTKVSELASLIADKTQIKLEQINLYDDLSASSVSSHALKPDTTVPNSKEPNKPLKLKLRQSRHVDKKDLHKALVNKIDTLDQIANQYQLWQHSYPSTFVEASQFSCDTLPTETIDTHLEEIRQDMNNCLSYIQNNNLTKLQQLINDNPYLINSQLDQNGNTALKAAAQHDKTGAILNWLIKKGAMIETKNIPGDSALIVAIKNGNKIGVETMLAAEQAEQKDIKELYLNRLLRENLTTQNYLTAMPSASKNLTTAINERIPSHIDFLDYLIDDSVPNPPPDLQQALTNLKHALHKAIELDQAEIVKVLLDCRVHRQSLNMTDLLATAYKHGKSKVFFEIIKQDQWSSARSLYDKIRESSGSTQDCHKDMLNAILSHRLELENVSDADRQLICKEIYERWGNLLCVRQDYLSDNLCRALLEEVVIRKYLIRVPSRSTIQFETDKTKLCTAIETNEKLTEAVSLFQACKFELIDYKAPIVFAAELGNAEAVRALIQKSANKDINKALEVAQDRLAALSASAPRVSFLNWKSTNQSRVDMHAAQESKFQSCIDILSPQKIPHCSTIAQEHSGPKGPGR